MIAFRPAAEHDLDLVFATWLSSFRNARARGPIPRSMYRDVYAAAIRDLLNRPSVRLLVAYVPDEEKGHADLFGWICFELGPPPVVHFIYVLHPYRRQGLGRQLFQAAGIDPGGPFLYSYKTAVVSRLVDKIPRALWDQMPAWVPGDNQGDENGKRN